MELSYTLDAGDRLVGFSDTWNDSAEADDGPGALAERLLGRSLWDAVTGEAVRHRLGQLFAISRHSGQACQMGYRCDTRQLQRIHRMRCQPAPGGVLHVSHRTIWSAPHDPAGPAPRVLPDTLPVCSRCLKANFGSGWVPLHGHPGDEELPVVYGLCDACDSHLAEVGRRMLHRSRVSG